MAVSVAGQFIVHLSCLVATLALCGQYMTEEDPTLSADGKFQPNVVNSAVFMLSAVMQVHINSIEFSFTAHFAYLLLFLNRSRGLLIICSYVTVLNCTLFCSIIFSAGK